ncbi:MAG: RnfABCDGE type electron transport complex subunit B [Kiritimatiellia bacterium]
MEILLALAAMAGTGLVCALVLVAADRFFAVREDPRIESVTAMLPGANCGGCGFPGCAEYAKAIVTQNAAVNLCGPGGADTACRIAALLGVEAGSVEKKVALVMCGGDATKTVRKALYNGVADCFACHALGGDKLCQYGCLGYGSCARVCPTGAIEIRQGLAVVHPDLCIGCGRCVRACPRNIIKMVPVNRIIHVLCSSKDRGPVVKKACAVGCIGCTLCTKLAKNEAIRMDGALAVVDYSKDPETDVVVEKCPGHCIVKRYLDQPLSEEDRISSTAQAATGQQT